MTDIRQFLKYIVAGGTAAAAHLTILWIGVEFVDLPEVPSSFIGFCVAIIVNYSLQHKFVFKKDGGHGLYFKRYFVITIVMQGVNVVLFWFLITFVALQYLIAQIIVIGVIFICNYIINSIYTFKS